MAETTPRSFTPWFETLRGISRSGSPSDIEGAPASRSYSSKVSPNDVTAMRTTADSEPYSIDPSFSFSRSVNFEPAPKPPARKSFGTVPEYAAPQGFGPGPGSLAPKGFESVPESPAPKSTFDKGPAVDVQPKKEALRSLPPVQTPPVENPSVPPALLLPPPPMSPKAKAGDVSTVFSFSSPATKTHQRQVGQDFIYHPKSDDTFYPSVKYNLGPPEKKPSRKRRCCCWALFSILLVVLGLGIAVGVLMVELNPKTPSLSIGEVSVPSLNFTPSTGSSVASKLAIGVDFPFNLTNPNKHAEVLYNDISVSVYFQALFLGSTTAVPAFEQGTGSTSSFTTDLPRNVTTVPSDNLPSLKAEWQDGDVQIDLGGSVEGKYKILGHKVKKFSIPIACQLTLKAPNATGKPATIVNSTCY